MIEDSVREALEHDQIKASINILLTQSHGKKFIKYLFTNYSVGDFAPVGMSGDSLLEYNAWLRAGNEIYKIVLEAAPELTGQLISEIEKERQDVINKNKIRASGRQ